MEMMQPERDPNEGLTMEQQFTIQSQMSMVMSAPPEVLRELYLELIRYQLRQQNLFNKMLGEKLKNEGIGMPSLSDMG